MAFWILGEPVTSFRNDMRPAQRKAAVAAPALAAIRERATRLQEALETLAQDIDALPATPISEDAAQEIRNAAATVEEAHHTLLGGMNYPSVRRKQT
ncbi:hypothetical protein CFR73_03995 [Novacetimonas maltaceti]|uniref:Uncharacterized protein n=1 Tax=Novacetimonas maltaceti TaxID=1203393 RepID=A0A2S3W4G8_9PROT|nr:hypothetical protein [Novacetimonas maltaceti]POF63708.1 hypothetical protein KMAL_06760 [Novacetimonas maltaceti]PYD61237.1 hypothetical protein CFR73_03995 [Novacetimonas maltaceti]